MRYALPLVFSLLAACGTTRVRHQRHETRLALLVPELIRANEPVSDSVTVLLDGGRALRFYGVEVHRTGGVITVDAGEGTRVLGDWPVEAVRAVLLVDQSSSALD